MAPVEPASVEEAQDALALRAHMAKKYMLEGGLSTDEAMYLANLSMLVLAYRAAVAETGQEMADDAEKFLEGK